MMSVYLHDVPLGEAQARFDAALTAAGLGEALGNETIPLDERGLGRVLAEAAWARISSPHFHAAAMDGFAVRATDTEGASESRPVKLTYGAQAEYVDTGDRLPEQFNAVIPIELTEPLDSDGNRAGDIRRPSSIRIRAAMPPWQHVRVMGEDMVATELAMPVGRVLRPVDLGAIAASGHSEVVVARKPRVAIFPTGDEIVPIGANLQPGEILETNSIMLAAQVQAWGGEATRFPILPDDPQKIAAKLKEAAPDFDLLLLLAGSSAGSEDYSARVVAELGELLVHGVAVRPGHPVILGMAHVKSKSVPIIGVPGFSVSAALTGEIFVEPLLARWLGRPAHHPQVMEAELTRKVTSPGGDDDYLRVVVGRVGKRILAAPLSRGAGILSSLARADGLVVLPRGVQGAEAGEKVDVRMYRSPAEIEDTIFCVGSHDFALDLLAQFLSPLGRRLVSAHVGSVGGLIALQRGEAHTAGSHLLDPITGDYNVSYVRQYLPRVQVNIVGFVKRQQGLVVAAGNPKNIRGLSDLTRPAITFVNRQRGAGTRVLLDYHLDLLGIDPMAVAGYTHEEYTHMAVTAAVASGRADCGMAVEAAAKALQLDFIPLFHEKYDLIIPVEHYESSLLEPLLALLHEEEVREAVAALPGYDIEPMGKVTTILE